jgi:hypothetical protein
MHWNVSQRPRHLCLAPLHDVPALALLCCPSTPQAAIGRRNLDSIVGDLVVLGEVRVVIVVVEMDVSK